jgi:hypothetical protein
MSDLPSPDTLETLVCELGRRPKGAPTIGDIVTCVTAEHRQADDLVITFDPSAADLVSAVVDAERQCCATIGWELETTTAVHLRLSGTASQLDALAEMFSPLS